MRLARRANDAGDTPLTVSARSNLVELTRLLVDEAKDLDVNGTDGERRTALIVAAENGHEDVARVLIETNGER
jgi:ankyrin repeat protein